MDFEKIIKSTRSTRRMLRSTLKSKEGKEATALCKLVLEQTFGKKTGRFGGSISTEDAIFLFEFVNSLRPSFVFEIGTASGFSATFLAKCLEYMELLCDDDFSLLTIDAVKQHKKGQIGKTIVEYFPELKPHCSILPGMTSIDVLSSKDICTRLKDCRLCFIDGSHRHPWPVIDICITTSLLPAGSWIILHDINQSERYHKNALRLTRAPTRPFRGCQIAFSSWPGFKIQGIDGCYNIGAIQVPVGSKMIREFWHLTEIYPLEKKVNSELLKTVEKLIFNQCLD